MISLSKRLAAVCELVPPVSSLADIGTDHGYVPIFLRETGRIETAVAADIHEGPAERAREHIGLAGLSDFISVRVGGGLSVLTPGEADGAVIAGMGGGGGLSVLTPGEVDGAVMAGMGGLMMIEILEEGRAVASEMKFLVLQPQNHQKELRLWLAENGYVIDAESLVREDRRFYEMFRVRRGEMEISEREAETGLLKFREQDPLFPDFLKYLIQKKDLTIRQIAPETTNEKNRKMRARALSEKEELEGWLCRYR